MMINCHELFQLCQQFWSNHFVYDQWFLPTKLITVYSKLFNNAFIESIFMHPSCEMWLLDQWHACQHCYALQVVICQHIIKVKHVEVCYSSLIQAVGQEAV